VTASKIKIKIKIKVKGARTGVSVLHWRRCAPLDSRGGCPHMSCGAAGGQQVPRAPSRARNDKT
jgi:hypothetical protein